MHADVSLWTDCISMLNADSVTTRHDAITKRSNNIKQTSKSHRVGLGLCWFCQQEETKRIHECWLCLTTADNQHRTLLIQSGLGLWFANKAQTVEGLPNQTSQAHSRQWCLSLAPRINEQEMASKIRVCAWLSERCGLCKNTHWKYQNKMETSNWCVMSFWTLDSGWYFCVVSRFLQSSRL